MDRVENWNSPRSVEFFEKTTVHEVMNFHNPDFKVFSKWIDIISVRVGDDDRHNYILDFPTNDPEDNQACLYYYQPAGPEAENIEYHNGKYHYVVKFEFVRDNNWHVEQNEVTNVYAIRRILIAKRRYVLLEN